jgi:hypothetical protein
VAGGVFVLPSFTPQVAQGSKIIYLFISSIFKKGSIVCQGRGLASQESIQISLDNTTFLIFGASI